MFTGLVEQVVEVVAVRDEPPGRVLVLDAPSLAAESAIGDSVALNGCCLTAVNLNGGRLEFEAGPETLERTNLGELKAGSFVNVERAMRLEDRLGGHLVTGHIDGTGRLDARVEDSEWSTSWFAAPPALMRQMASKGSIAVDGVSLTLVDVEAERFSVMLIPHTLENTTLGRLSVGGRVNLETDLLAKYVERQLQSTR